MSKEADIPPQEIDRRLFLLIRVPKSGSTSLVKMVDAACPNARHFGLPDETKLTFGRDPDEVIRHFLTRYKRLLRPYGTWSFEKALAAIGAQAKPGDILCKHVSWDQAPFRGEGAPAPRRRGRVQRARQSEGGGHVQSRSRASRGDYPRSGRLVFPAFAGLTPAFPAGMARRSAAIY